MVPHLGNRAAARSKKLTEHKLKNTYRSTFFSRGQRLYINTTETMSDTFQDLVKAENKYRESAREVDNLTQAENTDINTVHIISSWTILGVVLMIIIVVYIVKRCPTRQKTQGDTSTQINISLPSQEQKSLVASVPSEIEYLASAPMYPSVGLFSQ